MSGVMWQALLGMPNPGQAFADAYQQGIDKRKQEQQLQLEKAKVEEKEWVQYIGNLAAWADTEEKWEQAVAYLAANGHPQAAQFSGKFSTARIPLMAQANIAPPKETDSRTALQRNYEFLQGVNPELAGQYLEGQAQGPPIFQRNEDGTITVFPRSMLGGAGRGVTVTPGAVVDDPRKGDAGGNASGGFPRSD